MSPPKCVGRLRNGDFGIPSNRNRIFYNQRPNLLAMYILQSIIDKANAVWVTETRPMWKSTAESVLHFRTLRDFGVKRFRLIKVKG